MAEIGGISDDHGEGLAQLTAPGDHAWLWRYGMAAAVVAIAFILTFCLQQLLRHHTSQFLFYAAAALIAWQNGFGPGIFAALLCAPLGYHLYVSANPTVGTGLDSLFMVGFLSLSAGAGAILNRQRRKAEAGQRQSNLLLAAKAEELQKTCDALRAQTQERIKAERALCETQAELARIGRLTAMGELAATIAHEINQPLSAIATNAGACLRWLDPNRLDIEEVRAGLIRITRDSERAGAVIGRVRAMVAKALPERALLDIGAVIAEVLTLTEHEIEKNGIEVRTQLAADLPKLPADRIQMQQVLLNLVMNAIEAMAANADISKRLCITARRRGDGIVVEVEDTGCGFDGAIADIFEAFASSKQTGMGLGLSISRGIAEAHGGELTAEPNRPRGAVFRLILPGGELS